jgi:hypothetical protein
MQPLKWISILLILFGSLHAEMSIKNIEKMVKQIRAKRTSKLESNTTITSPFIVVQKDQNRSVVAPVAAENEQASFVLGAIVNTTAFIDGAWHRVGDTIGDFRLESIAEDHVVLKRKNRTITLYFRKAKNILSTGEE